MISTYLVPLMALFCMINNHRTTNAAETKARNSNRKLKEDDYPVILHCNVNKTLLDTNNTILHNFDAIEATPIENEEHVKLEFLMHDKVEHDTAMGQFRNCTVDVSTTYEYHYDAMQAMSNHTTKTFMSTTTSSQTKYETISETYNCFRSINGIYQTIKYLNTEHSSRNIIQIETIGQSYLKSMNDANGDDLVIVRLSNFNITKEKSNILLVFGIHAREYAPPELGIRFIEYLIQNFNDNANIQTILDTTVLHFLLYSNPDGRRIAEKEPMLYIRKNRNKDTGCGSGNLGVDLNRNFPFMWGGLGASSHPCSETFRGPSSQSEPETQAIISYAMRIFPDNQRRNKNLRRGYSFKPYPVTNTGIFLDVHSYGQLNIYPWSYENKNTPNLQAYIATSTKLSYFNQHKNAGPLTKDYLYEASGDTTDFMYGALGVLSFTLEIGNKFYERCTFFESKYAPNNIRALLYISKLAARPYSLPFGPDVTSIDYDITTIEDIHYLCITAVISDKLYATDHNTNLTYVTGIQDVVTAHVVIDEYPYNYYDSTSIKEYTSHPMIQNDQNSSVWNIVIPLPNLKQGSKHIFHVYAIDSSNDVGPLSSEYFYICDDNSSCSSSSTTMSSNTKTCNSLPCSLIINKDLCLVSSNVRRCAWDDSNKLCTDFPTNRRRRRWHERRKRSNIGV